jgi:hypothetical protein
LPAERVRLSIGGSRPSKVLLGGSVLLALVGLLSEGRHPFLLVVAALLLLGGLPDVTLSEVETDGLYLYVSLFWRSAQIPLTDVVAVRLGRWWSSNPRVVVDLRAEPRVGKKFEYVPPLDWMSTAYDHRAVRELKALVAQATRNTAASIP